MPCLHAFFVAFNLMRKLLVGTDQLLDSQCRWWQEIRFFQNEVVLFRVQHIILTFDFQRGVGFVSGSLSLLCRLLLIGSGCR